MDNLTHSLFGLTLARTPLGRAGRGTTAALLLASNAPDVDIIVTAGGAANYLEFHRGPTHGLLGVAGLGLLVAAVVWFGRKRFDRNTTDPPASFLMLWAVAAIGIVCHVLMDLPTSYGTRPLSPFTWTWYGFDWMPIVDLYLLAILGGGFWFSRGPGTPAERAARRSRNAAIALLLMAANYGLRATTHHAAIARAPDLWPASWWMVRTVGLAEPHDRPLAAFPGVDLARSRSGRRLVELAAMPDFLSPFSWRLIAQLSNGYEIRDVNLLADSAREEEHLATGCSRFTSRTSGRRRWSPQRPLRQPASSLASPASPPRARWSPKTAPPPSAGATSASCRARSTTRASSAGACSVPRWCFRPTARFRRIASVPDHPRLLTHAVRPSG
ncbi:MAG: metal-dependent hydrolase [Vicinamibacterales bacterium]